MVLFAECAVAEERIHVSAPSLRIDFGDLDHHCGVDDIAESGIDSCTEYAHLVGEFEIAGYEWRNVLAVRASKLAQCG